MDVHYLDRLLATAASVRQIDEFLERIAAKQNQSPQAKELVNAFYLRGYLRNQINFLLELYKRGFHIDAINDSRVMFLFLNGVLSPFHFAEVRALFNKLTINCIYLYDDRVLNYSCGIRQLGSNVKETNESLKVILKKLNADRVFTIGYSAGGFAAINCALSLNAYGSINFSPFTTFLDRDYCNDGRGQMVVDRIRRAAPETLIDVVPFLKEREPPLKLVSFFGADMPQDNWQSMRLRGLKDTYLGAINGGAVHDVMTLLIASGTFEKLFQRLSEGASLEESLHFSFKQKQP